MSAKATIDSQLSSKTVSFDEIPVIDVSGLIDGSSPSTVADKIGQACEKVGFFYIKGHGVPESMIRDAYAMAEAFFARPFEEKNQLNVVNSGQTLRGYIPTYAENVDPGKSRDFKECFDYGLNEDKVSPFFGPNIMPKKPAGFAETMEAYHAQMMTLSRKIIGGISMSLGLPADYFERLQCHPITIQRLLHYPSQVGNIREEEIGIGAHTDYGFLTILAQDSVGGLQVRNREGDWISAPPIDGTFIVNIGDLVQTFTNDHYQSTMHRVVNASGRERYSLPFFIDLDFDAVVEVLPNFSSPRNPPRYTPYTSGNHKFERFKKSYTHLQE